MSENRILIKSDMKTFCTCKIVTEKGVSETYEQGDCIPLIRKFAKKSRGSLGEIFGDALFDKYQIGRDHMKIRKDYGNRFYKSSLFAIENVNSPLYYDIIKELKHIKNISDNEAKIEIMDTLCESARVISKHL